MLFVNLGYLTKHIGQFIMYCNNSFNDERPLVKKSQDFDCQNKLKIK